MPAGRPTDYREEYNEQIVSFCADGYSLTAFAGKIGTTRQSITNWANDHPLFFVAVQRAKAACGLWWEQRGRGVALDGGPGGQATMVIFGLKNHAPDDYQDITKQHVTGKDGEPLIPTEPDRTKLAIGILTELRAVFAAKEEEKPE